MTTTPLPHLSLFPVFVGLNNQALDAALEALPDYRQQEVAEARIATALQAAMGDLLKATQARLAHVRTVVDTAKADKDQPANLAAQAAKGAQAVNEAREAVAILQEAARILASGRDNILSMAASALAGHLNGQLQGALHSARALELGGATDAQGALDAGTGAEWQSYVKLSATAAEIREAQRLVATHLSRGSGGQHLDTFGAVRNYGVLFPAWFDRQRRKPISSFNGEPIFPSPPWAEDDPSGLWAYAVQHHEVDLWVPSQAQVDAAYSKALADARLLAQAEERDYQNQPLTADEKQRLQLHRILERQHLTPTH